MTAIYWNIWTKWIKVYDNVLDHCTIFNLRLNKYTYRTCSSRFICRAARRSAGVGERKRRGSGNEEESKSNSFSKFCSYCALRSIFPTVWGPAFHFQPLLLLSQAASLSLPPPASSWCNRFWRLWLILYNVYSVIDWHCAWRHVQSCMWIKQVAVLFWEMKTI